MRTELHIALRYLKPQKNEGFTFVVALFSFLGMMLGVATLIVVMSVMNGFRAELFAKILGVNGHISVFGASPDQSLTDYGAIADKIRLVEGVGLVTPMIETQALATHQGRAQGVMVKAMSKASFEARPLLGTSIIEGSLDGFEGKDAAILGYKLAARLGLNIGDALTLVSPETQATPFGMKPRSKMFQIVGLSKVDMHEYDNSMVYIPLTAAQAFFRMPTSVSFVDVITNHPNHVETIRNDIAKTVGQPYKVRDWQQMNASFYQVLGVERSVMFIILTLIILVAAFNIISSQIMLSRSKQGDIAILRTFGARQRQILKVFLCSGGLVGVTGTVTGGLLGLLISWKIHPIFVFLRDGVQSIAGVTLFDPTFYYLSSLPAKVEPGEVIGIVAMALILSLLASLYPAWKAARIDPVAALRYE